MNNIDAWQLENSYAEFPGKFYTRIKPTPVNAPKLIIFNEKLANSLGIDLSYDDDDEEALTQLFSGNSLPKNSNPICTSICGHQFGHFPFLVMEERI